MTEPVTADPNTCLGPHPCPGCGTSIDSREVSCSACWLSLPRSLKIAAWSCWPHQSDIVVSELLPKVLAELAARAAQVAGASQERFGSTTGCCSETWGHRSCARPVGHSGLHRDEKGPWRDPRELRWPNPGDGSIGDRAGKA